MKSVKKLITFLLIVCLTVPLYSCAKQTNEAFKYWNKDASSLRQIIEYVEDVTNEKSDNYIPEEDRIVVFDMDGTLYGERGPAYVEDMLYTHRVLDDPNYEAPESLIVYAKAMREAVENRMPFDDSGFSHYNAIAFAGMTIEEFDQYVKDYTNSTACKGFENLMFADAFFLPMVEVVDYLNDNGFTIYVCSGTDRYTCRALLNGHVNVKTENIIGCDVAFFPDTYQGDSMDSYQYEYSNKLVRSSDLISECWEGDKVNKLAIEIGKQPVMVFGNSLGDSSMAIYATDENPYKSMAVMLMADDTKREYSDVSDYEKRKAIWDEYGWTVISMKNDWTTIYGEHVEVLKTDGLY